MEEKEILRHEAVKLINLGPKQDSDDHLCLKMFMIKSLDKSEKIRRTVFKRLLDEDFKFHCFKEDDRILLIMNGLKDPDEKVVTYCKQYL